MADLAVGRETQVLVIWVLGRVEVLEMAGHTVRGKSRELAVHMTVRAEGLSVLSSERKEIMREFRSLPAATAAVAELALSGESRSRMIRLPGFPVILFMTFEAPHGPGDKA